MPQKHVHPSENCYKRHRCRCAECREFVRLARNRRKDGIIAAAREREHPSYQAYRAGCRCVGCREFNRLHSRKHYDKMLAEREQERQRQVPNVLPPAELERLRRAVGLI